MTNSTTCLSHFYLFAASAIYLGISGRFYIQYLKKTFYGQYIREDGPQSHLAKQGTPTMGGLMFIDALIAALLVGMLLVPGMFTTPLWLTLGVTFILGALGFTDDYLKVAKKKNKGVTGYTKLAVQVGLGLILGYYVMAYQGRSTVDFFGLAELDLGILYPLFTAFVLTGASNAVNLTDGVDGLAASTMTISLIALSIIINPISASLSLLAAACAGVCAGFLIYNRNPAKVFMGDTGSLALGGLFGALGILTGQECWLVLIGGVFILETLSVILQVAYFKRTGGKRLFKMAPLHHHFELSGLNEKQVVASFAGAQFIFCCIAVLLARF